MGGIHQQHEEIVLVFLLGRLLPSHGIQWEGNRLKICWPQLTSALLSTGSQELRSFNKTLAGQQITTTATCQHACAPKPCWSHNIRLEQRGTGRPDMPTCSSRCNDSAAA